MLTAHQRAYLTDLIPEHRSIGSLQGNVCSAAHRDADGGRRQGRSVIDTIAHHGDWGIVTLSPTGW
jgi:hypothetical protein